MISASWLFSTRSMVNVEYAMPRCEQTGSVSAMVFTHSSMGSPSAIMVDMIFAVSVDNMLAFTPLPSPSASTTTVDRSPCSTIST
jgi:hypothetical protein